MISTNCTDCPIDSHRTLSPSNTCLCDLYLFDNNTDICASCADAIDGCLICDSATACTFCGSNYYKDSFDMCICNNGLYRSAPGVCSPCSSVCYTCDTIETNCTGCRPDGNYIFGGNTCSCGVGSTDNGTACVACSGLISGCVECSNTT